MKTLRHLRLSAALLMLALLTACAQMGLTSTKFEDKAYAASLTIDAIQRNTSTLLNAGKITPADARNALQAADVAVEGIKVARTYAGTAPATANSRLDAAVIGLTALTAYLNSQGAKP